MLRSTLLLLLATFCFQTKVFAKEAIGLPVGSKAPKIDVKDVDGQLFSLTTALKSGPVIVVFYRGGWCPYCNIQLRNLQQKVVPQLKSAQAKMIAISVDRVDEALKTKKQENLGMTIISDPTAKILKSYNVVNQVSQELVKKYKDNYKIDLEKASGKKHHIIAIPAVFTINKKGVITFSYANENYKIRAQEKDIISSLKTL